MTVYIKGAVAGGLSPLFGDPARLESLATHLNALADEVSALGRDAQSSLGAIPARAAWTGTAADSYLTFVKTKSNSITAVAAPLHEIAAAVRDYAEALSGESRSARGAVQTAESCSDPAIATHRITAAESLLAEATHTLQQAASHAASRTDEAKGALEQLRGAFEFLDKIDKMVSPLWKIFELVNEGPLEEMVQEMDRLKSIWLAGPVNSLFGLLTGDSTWEDLESALTRYGTKVEALETFTTKFGLPARTALSWMENVEKAMRPLEAIGAGLTLVSPGDKGALGWVDRGMATVQLAGIAAETEAGGSFIAGLAGANSLDEVPVVGEAVMAVDVGTAIYFGGKEIYQHRQAIEHAVSSAAHVVADVGTNLGKGAAHAATSVGKKLISLL